MLPALDAGGAAQGSTRDCAWNGCGGKAAWPSLGEAVFEGAVSAERHREGSNLHGMRQRVVARDPTQKGFGVLAGRWTIERSFGWLVHWGGLLRDRAGEGSKGFTSVAGGRLPEGASMSPPLAWLFAAALSGVEALLNPMPIHAVAR